MAKVVKGALKVVGAVASVLALVPGPHQPIAAAVATVSAIASTALEVIAPTKPKSSVTGSQTQFKLDPNAGIPYAIGRTFYAGNVVHRDTWGTDNQYQGMAVVYSLGPVQSVEGFYSDSGLVTFDGAGNANGSFRDWMYLKSQLGATPSPALGSPVAGFPGIGAATKYSGYCVGHLVLKYDTKDGKKFPAGVPRSGKIVIGPEVYDPRQDGSFPGGAGACRALQFDTYVGGAPAENPWIKALTLTLGIYHNGHRVFGVGAPVENINVQSFVDCANVADANGWKAGGIIHSTDDKWEVLKMLAQAGGGQVMKIGGTITAFCETPRISVATIREEHLVGEASVAAAQLQRVRKNGVVPIFRSEAHGWEQIPGDPVRFEQYVTEDGRRVTEETEFVLVQDKDQAAELAAYEILNSREIGPIDLPVMIQFLGVEPGDQVDIDIDALGLLSQEAVVLTRQLDPTTAAVQLGLRSETTTKHATALGTTTDVPPSPTLSGPDLSIIPAPGGGAWAAAAAQIIAGSDENPIIRVTGSTDLPTATGVMIEYRPVTAPLSDWKFHSTQNQAVEEIEISQVTPNTQYEIAVSYVRLGLPGTRLSIGTVTTGNRITGSAASAVIADTLLGEGALAREDTADWMTQVGNRPGELTDGRITIAINGVGDLQGGIASGLGRLSILELLDAGLLGSSLSHDPTFSRGISHQSIYNNAGGSAVSTAWVSDDTAPNGSGKILRISYDGVGPSSPGYGGSVQSINHAGAGNPSRPGYYAPGTELVFKIKAKIPVGRRLNHASNATGTGAVATWLSDRLGTGNYETYILSRTIGETGSFSSTGHFWIDLGAATAFDWDVAEWEIIEKASAMRTFVGAQTYDLTGNHQGETDVITIQGIASGFTGEGVLARLDQVDAGGPEFVGILPTAKAHADLQNTNQAWNDVSGAGLPADNATVGATWSTDLAGRPTELTDGRILAGIGGSGLILQDVPQALGDHLITAGFTGEGVLAREDEIDVRTHISNPDVIATAGIVDKSPSPGTTLSIIGNNVKKVGPIHDWIDASWSTKRALKGGAILTFGVTQLNPGYGHQMIGFGRDPDFGAGNGYLDIDYKVYIYNTGWSVRGPNDVTLASHVEAPDPDDVWEFRYHDGKIEVFKNAVLRWTWDDSHGVGKAETFYVKGNMHTTSTSATEFKDISFEPYVDAVGVSARRSVLRSKDLFFNSDFREALPGSNPLRPAGVKMTNAGVLSRDEYSQYVDGDPTAGHEMSSAAGGNLAYSQIPMWKVNPKATYKVRGQVKSNAAVNGFYARFTELDTEPPLEATHIGQAGVHTDPDFVEITRMIYGGSASLTGGTSIENGNVTAAWQDFDIEIDPTVTAKWMAFAWAKWSGLNGRPCQVRNLKIEEIVPTTLQVFDAPQYDKLTLGLTAGGVILQDVPQALGDHLISAGFTGEGVLAREDSIDAGGAYLIGILPTAKAHADLQNTNQDWNDVSGAGIPADNATVGATWSTNVSGRPTELTDGRILAGIGGSGLILQDVPQALGDHLVVADFVGAGVLAREDEIDIFEHVADPALLSALTWKGVGTNPTVLKPFAGSLKHTGGVSNWSNSAVSNEIFGGGCSLRARPGMNGANRMIGLIDADHAFTATTNEYAQLDYCWYPISSNAWYIYESGSSKGINFTSTSDEDVFEIEYRDGNIYYLANGAVVRTVEDVGFDRTFRVAGSYNTLGSMIHNISCESIGSKSVRGLQDLEALQTWVAGDRNGDDFVRKGGDAELSVYHGWQSRLHGPTFTGAAFMQFRLGRDLVNNDRAFAGLTFDFSESGGNAYQDLFGAYAASDATMHFYRWDGVHGSSLISIGSRTWTEDDVISIFLVGDKCRFYKNEEYIGEAAVPAGIIGAQMRPAWMPLETAAKMYDMRCGPYDPRLEATAKGLDLDGLVNQDVPQAKAAHIVAAAITGEGTGARADNLAEMDAAEGAKLAGIEDDADRALKIEGISADEFFFDYQNQPKDGQFNRTYFFKLLRAGVDLTASAAFTYAIIRGKLTKTDNPNGQGSVRLSAIDASLSVLRITATLSGKSITHDVSFIRQKDGAPPLAIAQSYESQGGNIESGIFSELAFNNAGTGYSQKFIGNMGAGLGGSTVTVKLELDYVRNSVANGTTKLTAIIEYRDVGGAWSTHATIADAGGAVTSNTGANQLSGKVSHSNTRVLTAGEKEWRVRTKGDNAIATAVSGVLTIEH